MRWGKVVTDVIPYIEEEAMEDAEIEQGAEDQFKDDHFNKKQKEVKKFA